MVVVPPTESYYRQIFTLAIRGANTRNIPFKLTKKQFEELVQRAGGRCMVSGIPFSTARMDGSNRRPWAPSLDRVDSSKAYTLDNVRLVCMVANIAMNDWGYDIRLNRN